MRNLYLLPIFLVFSFIQLSSEEPGTLSADQIWKLAMADEFTRVKTLDGLGFKFDENDKEKASFVRNLLDEGTACERYSERVWLWKESLEFLEYVTFDSTNYYQIKEEILSKGEPFTLKGNSFYDWDGIHVQFEEAEIMHKMCIGKVYILYLNNYNPHSHGPTDDHDHDHEHNHDDHLHD